MTVLTLPDRTLAYQQRRASPEKAGKPGVVFLSGFASDMTGTKASFLDERCGQAGYACLRFDYRGHGGSSGTFEEGCIGDWADDAVQALDHLTEGPQIIVGSSMGGWIGLLLARARPERVAGFMGIAAAPDFTEELVIPAMSLSQKDELARTGKFYEIASPPENRVAITQKLLDEGKNNLLLTGPLKLAAPVRLLQGMRDDQVPWRFALRIAETLICEDVHVTLVKDADHRLSRPQDLELLWQTVQGLVEGGVPVVKRS